MKPLCPQSKDLLSNGNINDGMEMQSTVLHISKCNKTKTDNNCATD